jgi:hypothetical protein
MAFVCLVSGLAGPSTKNLFHSAMGCLLKAATDTSKPACTPANVELAVWLAVQLLLRKFQEIAMVLEATFLNSLSSKLVEINFFAEINCKFFSFSVVKL